MMRTYNTDDNLHKAWLYRILEAIADDAYLASVLYFKGGTCASMLEWLDRFSVDLDFDYAGTQENIPKTRHVLETIFSDLGLEIKDSSKNGIQYFLKYENTRRNTVKIDVAFPLFASSTYAPQRFAIIDKILLCQMQDTMFAHKLCAPMDRYKKTGHIAGRDLYDIHYFFMQGYTYNSAVIKERTGLSIKDFFEALVHFIEKEVTDQMITEDLSTLVSPTVFKNLRKVLKREVVQQLKEECDKLS